MSQPAPKFQSCEWCDSAADCAYNEECWFEHEFVRPGPGFDFTQDEEDRLNDPRDWK